MISFSIFFYSFNQFNEHIIHDHDIMIVLKAYELDEIFNL